MTAPCNKYENFDEVRIIIEKEQLLALYPSAICDRKIVRTISGGTRWDIISENKLLGFSYQSEEIAWRSALAVAYKFILDKFKGY